MSIVFARGMSRPLSMIAVAHEHVVAPLDEVEHHLLERALASPSCVVFVVDHLPVADGDARRRDELLQPLRLLVEPLDPVVDVEDLPAARELARHRLA